MTAWAGPKGPAWTISNDGTSKQAILAEAPEADTKRLSAAGVIVFPSKAREGAGITRDSAAFAKMFQEKPELSVAWPEKRETTHFHGAEQWLWGIWIAENLVAPFFVNLLSTYLYDQFGKKPDKQVMHLDLSVEAANGAVRRITYDGPAGDLLADVEKGTFEFRAKGGENARSK